MFPRAAIFIEYSGRGKMRVSGSLGQVAGCWDIPQYLGAYFCLIYCPSVFILQVFILERFLFTFLVLRGVHIWWYLLCRDLAFLLLPFHPALAAAEPPITAQQAKGSFCFQPGFPPTSPQPHRSGSSDKALSHCRALWSAADTGTHHPLHLLACQMRTDVTFFTCKASKLCHC